MCDEDLITYDQQNATEFGECQFGLLLLIMNKISGWQLEANCSPDDFDLFFSNSKTKRKQALSLCGTCPVINECLDYAMENNVEHGIYGGKTPEQRKVPSGRRNI